MTNQEIRTEATMAHRETGREFFADVVKLVDELERVRGLLQRITHELGGYWTGCSACSSWLGQDYPGHFDGCERCDTLRQAYRDALTALPTFPRSSSLVSQGAESADIGKLDRVDKSASVTFDEVMEWARQDFELLNFPNDGLRNAAWDLVKRVAQKAELIRELDETPCTGCPICADADEIMARAQRKCADCAMDEDNGCHRNFTGEAGYFHPFVPRKVEMGKVNKVDEKAALSAAEEINKVNRARGHVLKSEHYGETADVMPTEEMARIIQRHKSLPQW